jgi:hypothetical protein
MKELVAVSGGAWYLLGVAGCYVGGVAVITPELPPEGRRPYATR